MSPIACVREWAKNNPDQKGIVFVYVPKRPGKMSGRDYKTLVYYVSDGDACPAAFEIGMEPIKTMWQGDCEKFYENRHGV